MATMKVWTGALYTAANGWHDQQQRLHSARASLTVAEGLTQATGPRVAPALAAFLDTWIGEVTARRNAAERHGDALILAAVNYARTDEAAAVELAHLLPWDQRTMRPDA